MDSEQDEEKSIGSLHQVKSLEGFISCARYALTLFNIAFSLSGALLLSWALWLRWVPSNVLVLTIGLSSRIRDYAHLLTFVVAITGAAIMLMSVVGCCGTFSNSKFILGAFFMMLVIIFFVMIGIVALSLWIQKKIDLDTERQLRATFVQDYLGENDANLETIAWNQVQADLLCCGVLSTDGYKDYRNLTSHIQVMGEYLVGAAYWRNDMTSVHWPASCCVKNITGYVDLDKCQTDPAAPASVRFSKGCMPEVLKLLKLNVFMVVGLTIALLLIELMNFYILRQLEAALLGQDDDSIITEVSMDIMMGSRQNIG